jgi:hypothetical protein
VIRPGDYTDRGMFVERGVLYRPKIGAGAGVIEEVPLPWFEAFLLRWLPKLALSRAQARAALARLQEQQARSPTGVRVRNWDHSTQRWEPPEWVPSSPWVGARRR